jgi:hypothetical protein
MDSNFPGKSTTGLAIVNQGGGADFLNGDWHLVHQAANLYRNAVEATLLGEGPVFHLLRP